MTEVATIRIEAVLQPIPGESPAGRPARYDPDYEALKSEAEKIGGLASANVDWPKIGGLSAEILEKKSKDLLVMSYFCLALLQTAGYAGLAAGLGAMRKMLDTYWDRLFPEAIRMRARVSAIEWLVERCAVAVKKKAASAAEKEALGACLEAIEALDLWLRDKLLNEAPSFGDFRAALNERISAAAPAATAPSQPAAQPATASAPSVSHDLTNATAREEAFKDSMANLKSLASAIRHADAKDPVAYRLARVSAWSRVRALPPDTGGKTSVPPLGASAETAERLTGLAGRGEWAVLLDQAESQFGQSVLWLDVHRFSAQALRALGQEYERAERVVIHEVGLFLRAFPGMLDLAFASGMPFASAETRAWLEQEMKAAGETPAAAHAAVQPAAGGAGVDEAVARAIALARGGKLGDAVTLLAGGEERPASARDRFLRRLALARILADAREVRAALAQMEGIEGDLAKYGLEEWDPGLAAEALSVHLRLQRSHAKSEGKGAVEVVRKGEELYARLARLDARAALAMKA